jgi:Ca2+-transporting ATPase
MVLEQNHAFELQNWQQINSNDAFKLLRSDEQGLTHDEVQKRLRTFGQNTLPEVKRPSKVIIFVRQFKSPLIYILIVASVISFLAESVIDAGVILLIVVANAVIGYVQENKAENVLESLKELTAPKSKVRREGAVEVIDARNIVPGDILLVEAGDRVPADARLFVVRNLKADESMLTGESVTVDKLVVPYTSNMVYAGTIITEGRGEALVVKTGQRTEFGQIATSVQTSTREETPLQKDLARLGRWIGALVLVISAVIFAAGIARGLSLFDMFFVAISQAVSAIPEGLPAVATVVMVVGVRKMAGAHAIIRRLSAVETLGATNIILSDKTGTLTLNEMSVEKLWVGSFISVTGAGYKPVGTLIRDEDGSDARRDPSVTRLLTALVYASDAHLRDHGIVGDPTEGALIVAAKKAGLNKEELESVHPRRDELPFDPSKLYMATLNDRVYVKGAPEVILSRADSAVINGERLKLNEDIVEEILRANRKMAADGLRVLAAGTKDPQAVMAHHDFGLNPNYKSPKLDDRYISEGLTFVGLVGMKDPPRPEVKDALAISRGAGIRTVMVTGDNPHTAKAIAVQLGITDMLEEGLTSDELSSLTDAELSKVIKKVSVFARIRPLDKRRLVQAFKREGNIVAVTGDGVNDAPALINADIGVAMGRVGTEVAKEAADMVLTDDNYATIVTAIREGKRIYTNLRKVLLYLLSTNIAELIFIFSAINIGLPLPLLPVQILWVNLVTDGICVIPLGLEPEKYDVMATPPRRAGENIISRLMQQRIAFMSIAIAAGTLLLYYERLHANAPIEEARTMAFLTIAIFQLVNAFNCKSTTSILNRSFFSNRYLIGSIALALFLQLATVYVPFMQVAFRTVSIEPLDLTYVFAVCFSVLVLEEIRKRIFHPK